MITIIIVNYNSADALKKCVTSVLANTIADFQLLLIDNDSTDSSLTFFNTVTHPNITKIRNNENLGFPKAFNPAVRHATTDIVIGLDDDTIVPPGWDMELTKYLDNKTALVGAKIVYPDNRIFCAEYSIMPLGLVGYNETDLGQRDYQRYTDAVANTALAINRKTFLDAGGYDETFFPCQYEDIDLCYRIRKAGYKIFYNGALTIIHDNLFRSFDREDANRELLVNNNYAFKHYPFEDTHRTDILRALAWQAHQEKDYENAYIYYKELYENADFPAELMFFEVLTRLKKHQELKEYYHRRKKFFKII